MALEKEAGVRVKLKGSEELVSDTKKISDAWGEVGAKAGAAFKGMAGVVGSAVQGVLSDIGHVVSAASAISFASSVQSVAQLEGSFTRMAVASGRQIKSTQDGINALAQDIGEMPAATEQWIHSVGDLTYNYERAAQSAKGLQGFALQTGQSLGQVSGLASVLDQLGAGGEKSGHALEVLTHQADELGAVGGPRALSDMLQHLGGQITELSSTGGVGRITALMAGFGGPKGFTPQQRERALGGVMGRVEGNVEGFERFIGKGRLTDEFGHMKDMTSVIDELKKYGSKGIGQQRRLEFTFGREATAAIMHTNIAAIRDEERDIGGAAGSRALERMKGSAAGQLQADQIAANVKEQDQFGSNSLIGGVYRTVMGWKASNPLLTGVGVAAGFKGLAAGAKLLGGGGAAAGTGAAEATVAGGATTGGGGLLAGIGAGGLMTAGAGIAAMLGSAGIVLHGLGEGSAVHEGYDNRAIDADKAAGMRDRIKAANDAAAANMSPGMREALRLEQARKAGERIDADERAARAGQAPGSAKAAVDPRLQAMTDQLVKAGASLQLAQETAAKLLASGQQTVQIDVINNTGGPIEARPRGHQ